MPEEIATSLAPDTDFYDLLSETGLLAKARDGYTSAGLLKGVVVEARYVSGSELVFLSVTGGQVSNEHYPCYEVVGVQNMIRSKKVTVPVGLKA